MIPSWNTMTGRFIVLLMTALMTTTFIVSFTIQQNFDSLVIRSMKVTQLTNASHALRRIEASDLIETLLGGSAATSPVLAAWGSSTPTEFDGAARDLETERRLKRQLGLSSEESVRAWSVSWDAWSMEQIPTEAFRNEAPSTVGLFHAAILSQDGEWLNVVVRPRPQFWPISPSVLAPLIFAFFLVMISSTFAATHIARPFRTLTESAERLANGMSHEPLETVGPDDVRRAQTAFNVMASRLQSTLLSQRTLLAAIGHGLRTPITSFRTSTEVLADGEERDPMIRALDELQNLTEAALEAASSGQLGDHSERIDAKCLVLAVCDDLADLGHDVSFADTNLQAVILGKADQLSRAIRNVIENAVHYGDSARVELAVEQEVCLFTVSDNGPGVPDAEHERIFEPFVRLESSRSKQTGGHGLGLYIAANTIVAHGGKVALKNLEPRGMQVITTLPLFESSAHIESCGT